MNYRIGIDVGGTNIKAGVIDEACRIVQKVSIKTPGTFEESVNAIADLARDLAGQLGICMEDFPCIGIGVPCSVIPETGKLVFANNLGWKDVSLKDELSKYVPIPIFVGNDANCAIIGETIAGAAKGCRNVLMITLGTGVGSGIILNGKLFSGCDGLGSEIGHTLLVYEGLPCSCGLRGCFERYAAAPALIRQTKAAMDRHPESSLHDWVLQHGEVNPHTAFDCAEAGDETALAVVDQYASYIAAGLGSITNILRTETILIGGGISNAGEFLLERIRNNLPRYVLAYDVVGGPSIRKAALGNDAGIIGAAYLDQM